MKHTIEISTVDALLIAQLLRENNLENETDKEIAKNLKNMLVELVAKDLSEK